MFPWKVSRDLSPSPSNINEWNLCRTVMQCKSFYKLKGCSTALHSLSFTATPWTLSRSQVPKSGPHSPHAAAAGRDDSIAWGSPAPWGCFVRSPSSLAAAVTCSLQEKLGCFRKCINEQDLFSSQEMRGFKRCSVNKIFASSVHLFKSTAQERRYRL